MGDIGPQAPGAWVEEWLSVPRFAVYLADAGGDRSLALARYEWNSVMCAAVMHDLAHLEVGLRNAYDRAFQAGTPAGCSHWVFDAECWFPPRMRTAQNGQVYDDNDRSRKLIATAVKEATPKPNPRSIQPSPGKVIAELSFGFWRYLSKSAQDQPLWTPHLHKAFVPGTTRRTVDGRMAKLHGLRNRVAHHEPLAAQTLPERYNEILTVAGLISPDLRGHIDCTSEITRLLTERPQPATVVDADPERGCALPMGPTAGAGNPDNGT